MQVEEEICQISILVNQNIYEKMLIDITNSTLKIYDFLLKKFNDKYEFIDFSENYFKNDYSNEKIKINENEYFKRNNTYSLSVMLK